MDTIYDEEDDDGSIVGLTDERDVSEGQEGSDTS